MNFVDTAVYKGIPLKQNKTLNLNRILAQQLYISMFEHHECSQSTHVVIRDILVNEFSELEKISASFTEALMIFKLMNLHNTPWFFFYEAPGCVIQTQ